MNAAYRHDDHGRPTQPGRRLTLLDCVNELTRTHTHREPVTTQRGATTYTTTHSTRVPPLLHQLRFASPSGAGDERANTGYESRPAASLEALDTLTRIDHEVFDWLTDLGVRIPVAIPLDRGLQKLAALHRGLTDYDQADDLERDVRRWRAQARVVTGWDSPAWRPDNTCPMCAERGSLRVKLGDKVGLCVECRETWSEVNIGLLADHIRAESAAERPARELSLCWCAWPPASAVGTRWGSLCPSCGSRTCHRALRTVASTA